MPSLSKKIKLSPKTWFSLILTGFLLGAIVLTQFATTGSRDNRSQAATCNYSGSFQFKEPTSIDPTWTGWDGTYDIYVYKQGLSRSASNPANCGVNTWNQPSNGAGYTWTFNLPSTLQCGTNYIGDVALHNTNVAVSWNTNFSTSACPTPVPTMSMSASATTIPYNSSVTITWSSTNATSCNIVFASTSWLGLASSGSRAVTLTSTTTFTGMCGGPGGGSNSAGVVVNVQPQPVSTANIKANGSDAPSPIPYNSGVTISWTSSNASSCSVTGTSSTTTSGSFASGNLTASKTYTANCGGAADQVVVNVQGPPPAPSVDIKANNSNGPISISSNTAATLTWAIASASSCSASSGMPSGNWSTGGSNSSGVSTGILTTNKTYSITCGSASDSVVVNVSSPPGCGSNCGGTNPPSGGGSTPTSPPKVVPPSTNPTQQPTAGPDDLKLTFAPNAFLKGSMNVTLIIDATSINQNAVVSKDGGTLVIKSSGLLKKNAAYVLKTFSKNSLVQKIGFTYVNNTSLNIATFVTGDFNNDNSIDTNDTVLLVPNGIKSGEGLYDVNYDGVVNSVDYSLLLLNQGKKGS